MCVYIYIYIYICNCNHIMVITSMHPNMVISGSSCIMCITNVSSVNIACIINITCLRASTTKLNISVGIEFAMDVGSKKTVYV